MTVRLDLNGLMAGLSGPAGLMPDELTALEPELAVARNALAARRQEGGLAFAELPYAQDHLRAVASLAAEVRDRFDTMIVLGTGASAAGPRALVAALGDGDGAVAVSDAIDPAAVRALLADIDVERTVFNIVSKSGDSAETVARFLIVRDRLLRELGAVDYKRHLIVTTSAQRGALRQIVNDEGFRALDVPEVAARFGILSGVGLLPAAVAGVDVDELVAGARAMDERMRTAESPLADPAFVLAGALWALARRRNRQRLLVMPFSERLGWLASWFCRLWTESLATAPGGAQTPVVAAASADRHAHARVLADARRDASVLLLRVEDHGEALDIPAAYQDIEGVGSIGGNSLGTLLNAEQRATELALAREGGPSATLTLPALNAFTLGQVVFLCEMVTVASGLLAGGDPVAPVGDDPRERLLQALLGRAGTEAQRAELDAWVAAKDPRFVV